MAFIEYNPNPAARNTGDCVIRAICKVLGMDWEKAYIELSVKGLQLSRILNENAVWEAYLREKGYLRRAIANACPECYSIADFARDNPQGSFIVATGSHVVAVQDGDYYDTWDSGTLVPSYYFYKEAKA